MPAYKPINEQRLKETYASQAGKIPIEDIAKQFDISVGRFYARLHKLGIPLRATIQTVNTSVFTEAQKGYLAGIIDGEGSIQFGKQKGKPHAGITIANTNQEVLGYLHSLLKGSYSVTIPSWGNHKTSYHLNVTRIYDVEAILLAIKEYLIIKKPHAELMLGFIAMHKKHFLKPEACSQSEWDVYNKIRVLNRRGILFKSA